MTDPGVVCLTAAGCVGGFEPHSSHTLIISDPGAFSGSAFDVNIALSVMLQLIMYSELYKIEQFRTVNIPSSESTHPVPVPVISCLASDKVCGVDIVTSL